VFIILSVFTYFILSYLEKKNEQEYLMQVTQNYNKAFNTIYDQYKELSDVVYTGLLKLANVDIQMEDLNQKTYREQAFIRQDLYLQTLQRYKTLQQKKVININYILPNNTIFLKMRNPIKFGMKVSEKRKVLEYVQENKEAIDSYEIGKNGAGFRFVYPVIRNEQYLGAVSITFSEQAITSAIMKQYDVLSNVIIKDDNFDKEYLKNSKVYKSAHHKGFLHNVEVLKELKHLSKKDINQIKPSSKTSKEIYKQANYKTSMSMFLDDQDIIITTIPIIHKLTNEQNAFVSIISKGHGIVELNTNYFIITCLFIFLYGAILLIVYEQNMKRIIEKENLNKMIQKDKQLIEQSKMAQMGEMIGNIAHQWRQPLSTISTVASGVKVNQEVGLLDNNELPKNMDIIVNNAQYLSETIDTFRDFIKEKKEKKQIVLQERIDESVKIVKASIENNHIKLINEIEYEPSIKLTIIAQELSQVIINILNNAKDAIVQRKIDNGYIQIKTKLKSNYVQIIIEDNAGGIKAENLPKIFDPYFTTKHKFKGTGLGLYMSKTIIENHLDGHIYAKNSTNGAMFIIELPID